ncbi:unnamed protein product [Closterium sp. NIES-54]
MATLPRFDFGFAFREPSFSDCVLRLVIEPHSTGLHDISPATGSASSAKDREENDSLAAAAAATKVSEPLQKSTRAAAAAAPATAGAADPPAAGASPPETSTADAASRASLPPADPVTRDVPAASVVLASKSTFFRALFTSGFSETLDRRLVHIHLTAQEEPLMMELLQFIYQGTLPPDTVTSFERTLQLLLLADRFGVDEGIATCSSLLTSLTSLTSLPPHPSSSSSSSSSVPSLPASASASSTAPPSVPPNSTISAATATLSQPTNPPTPYIATTSTTTTSSSSSSSSSSSAAHTPSSLTTQQALLALSLPPSLHLNPLLTPLICASQACVVHRYGPLFNSFHFSTLLCNTLHPNSLHTSSLQSNALHQNHLHHITLHSTNPHPNQPASANELLTLPEAGIRALLESDELPVDSEESVFCALILWARHRFPGGELDSREEQNPAGEVGPGGEVGFCGQHARAGAGVAERRAAVGRLVREVRWAWVGAGFVRSVVVGLEEMQSEEARAVVLEGLFAAAHRGDAYRGDTSSGVSTHSIQHSWLLSPPPSLFLPHGGSLPPLSLLPPLPPPLPPHVPPHVPPPSSLSSGATYTTPPAFASTTNSTIPSSSSASSSPYASSFHTHSSLSTSTSHQHSQSSLILPPSPNPYYWSSPSLNPPSYSSSPVSNSWSRPRNSYRPPRKSLFLEIPFSQCQGWTPSVSFQATSGLFCIAGRWFTLNAKLECQKELGPRFGLFLRLDKHATFPGVAAESVNCQYRFCVKMDLGGRADGESCVGGGNAVNGTAAAGSTAAAVEAAAAATSAPGLSSHRSESAAASFAPAAPSADAGGMGVSSVSGSVGYCVVKSRSGCVFSEPYHGWGSRDLFKKPWDEVLAAPDVLFPEGAMHFRADIWID